MTQCYLAPDPIQSTFFIPGSNTPGNGVQVFFYVAGSASTKQTVYKDPAAAVAWTNPIVLDSGGNLPLGGEVWFPEGEEFKVVWAPAIDSDPPTSPYWSKDNLAGINDPNFLIGVEWISGPTPTFVSTNSFTVTGDERSTLQPGRRVKTSNTGGTSYGTITNAVFSGGLTTITLDTTNSIVLDAGLSSVMYALMSGVNPSIPAMPGGQVAVIDPIDSTKNAKFNVSSVVTSTQVSIPISNSGIEDSSVSTLTASGVVNLDTVSSKYVYISGTTTISQFILSNGRQRTVKFVGGTPLSNSSSLSFLGGGNVTTLPNYVMSFRGESGGVVRAINESPAWDLLAYTTAASTAAIIFNNISVCDEYQIKVVNALPIDGAERLILQMSTTNGTSFASTAVYEYSLISQGADGVSYNDASIAAIGIHLNNSTTNRLNNDPIKGGWSGTINLHYPSNTTAAKAVDFTGCYSGGTVASNVVTGSGICFAVSSAAVTGAQLIMANGSYISTGSFYLYGMRKAF